MVDHEKTRARVQELAERAWDTASITKWLRGLTSDGIPKRVLDPSDMVARKERVLESVERRAQDCTFLSHV